MTKICSNCHNIENKKLINDRYIRTTIFSAFMALITIPIFFIYPIIYLVTLFFFLMVAVGIAQFVKKSYICSKCNESMMITAETENALETTDANKYETLNNKKISSIFDWLNKLSYQRPKLCTECFYLGYDTNQRLRGFTDGLIFFVLGILLIPFGYSHPLTLLGSIFFIYLGIVAISMCFIDGKKCPQCKKKAMINLESNLAHIIIKQKNLDLPVEKIYPRLPLINQYFIDFIAGVLMLIIGISYLYLYQYLVRIHS